MDLVLGLDGGGTKTALALADRDGRILERQIGAPQDPMAEPDWQGALGRLLRTVDSYFPQIGAAVIGLPFHGEIADISAQQSRVVQAILPMRHIVENDVRAAFDGAFAGRAGVLILAGTGSMAWAGDQQGREHRIGGWGEAFGDEGSAYWIGREALSEASRACDGRTTNKAFADALLNRLGLDQTELMAWCYGQEKRRASIAGLARMIDELAEAGDAVARGLLQRAGDHLAEHAEAGWAWIGDKDQRRWSYAGGVLASRIVRDRIIERLGQQPEEPRLPPVGGALLRAAQLCGWAVDDLWIGRLGQALAAPVSPETFVKN